MRFKVWRATALVSLGGEFEVEAENEEEAIVIAVNQALRKRTAWLLKIEDGDAEVIDDDMEAA